MAYVVAYWELLHRSADVIEFRFLDSLYVSVFEEPEMQQRD